MNIAEHQGWVSVPMTLPPEIDRLAREVVALGNGERRAPRMAEIKSEYGPLTARAVGERAKSMLKEQGS
ncbi:hypothetical protein [Salinisphaera hydrothermalis]|uniref:Uncharacterized protein n=1 Tax=Salinisphaera hydrothermalis (strain C41B8) TaxID=1304275 RepID=A0A084INQ1_SALHC|nr:hypothetical protein [Salinisphaera hydrothermalis]KEZ78335.1 hypothetical protein C41B8_05518 [Salinisphaera hydrothermalis C41B8]